MKNTCMKNYVVLVIQHIGNMNLLSHKSEQCTEVTNHYCWPLTKYEVIMFLKTTVKKIFVRQTDGQTDGHCD